MRQDDAALDTLEHFDIDPEAFRRLGYQVIDMMADAIGAEPCDPVMRHAGGQEVRSLIDEPLPMRGTKPEQLFAACRDLLTSHGRKNGHPRFFGYVCASADPVAALADAMASVFNQNVTAWRSAPAATEIERLVVRWLDEMVGFNGGGSGLLVSGGSAANSAAISCAIANLTAPDQPAVPRETLTVYRSTQGHLSLEKAARSFGILREHIRTIDVDDHYRMIPDLLDRQLQQDQRSGLVPVCVCASAGTANTGAVDPLNEIADICHQRGIWLHIDGAYGAPAAMTEDYRWMQAAFSRADSLSLDPHKWLFAPLDVGCILMRDDRAAERAFTLQSEYTAVSEEDPIERYAFFDHGPELSRRFRALKVWIILKTRGIERISRVIRQNIHLRRYLDKRIAAEPRLESLGSDLSISCFRYLPALGGNEEAINASNRRIIDRLVADGRFYLSPTTLNGRFALRICIVNFRTTRDDMDLLADEVVRLGDETAR